MKKQDFVNYNRHAVQLSDENGKQITIPPGSVVNLSVYFNKYVPKYIRHASSDDARVIKAIPSNVKNRRIVNKTRKNNQIGSSRIVPKESAKLSNENFKIAVPPGIGDSLWSMTKIPSIREIHKDIKNVTVVVRNTNLNRSDDFLSRFNFVDNVIYENFPIHPPGHQSAYSKEGPYIYIDSRENWKDYNLLLISNGHLERGRRLEHWYPKYSTDFNIGKKWRFDKNHVDLVRNYRHKNGPYFIFYLGPKRGNTLDGHNRGPLWSLNDWARLAELLHNKYKFNILLTGAPYDRDYSDDFMNMVGNRKYIHNHVGEWPIGLTYTYSLFSESVFSYQSGIGIFSVYLDVPTVLWWRPYGDSISPRHFISFREEMASAWAPPESVTSGRYMPCIYKKCTPDSIFSEMSNRNWVGSRGEPSFTDGMTLI